MEYRVEELAAEVAISVELLRSYQSKGLLPPPRHEGRVAMYGEHHLDRLRAILDLKAQGHSLRMIAHLLNRPTRPSDPTLVDTLAGGGEETLSVRQLAERTRVPPAMLRSLEASGVLRPRRIGDERRFTTADVRAVRMLLTLIGGGLPMEEFMRVARTQLEAAEQVAGESVKLFMRYVREPLLASGLPEREEAERLVATFRMMLHATSTLMAYNFQRMVLNALQDEIDQHGSGAERAALGREVMRRRPEVLPA
jgi:DNA-binding transcriptional MerR regulator